MRVFFRRNLASAEWTAALLITVVALLWQWFSVAHAGGLWRDEICVVDIATLPTLDQVCDAMPHDHCPLLFLLLVRGWVALGFGGSDAGLRMLGLVCGLGLLAAYWLASRMMDRGLPLMALALAGLNFTVIRYGDSLRAYGLGSALIVLSLALVWRFMADPKPSRWWLACGFSVLSVQTLYQNAFLLLGIGLAGAVVCLRRRQPRHGLGVLGIGAVAAVSLLPYVAPLHHAQDWWMLSKSGLHLAGFLRLISEATGALLGVWVVLILFAGSMGLGCGGWQKSSTETSRHRDLLLFASLALGLGLVGFGCFIKLSRLPTEPWYYVPALVFAAVCCDAILPRLHPAARIWSLAVAVGIAVWAGIMNPAALQMKQTNGDQVAARVTGLAGSEDLIIVHPWYYGITFARNYRGTTPWTTLPPISDFRFHRYDQIKTQIQMTNPVGPVLAAIKATLRSGHRVLVVGDLPPPRRNATPPANLPPAPTGPQGWYDEPYTQVWGSQLVYFLSRNTAHFNPVEASPAGPVNPMENLRVQEAVGWVEPPDASAK